MGKCRDDMSASTWEYVAEIQGQERSLGKLTIKITMAARSVCLGLAVCSFT